MSYSVSIQLTLFQNLNTKGKVISNPQYGYRIYSSSGLAEYSNVYNTVDELFADINEESILDFIEEAHPEFFDAIKEDGGYFFNGEEISLDDDDDDIDYDEEYTDELFSGDKELEEEVQEILEKASDELI